MKTRSWCCPSVPKHRQGIGTCRYLLKEDTGIGEPRLSYNMNSSKKRNGDFNNQLNINNPNDNPPFTFAAQRRES